MFIGKEWDAGEVGMGGEFCYREYRCKGRGLNLIAGVLVHPLIPREVLHFHKSSVS